MLTGPEHPSNEGKTVRELHTQCGREAPERRGHIFDCLCADCLLDDIATGEWAKVWGLGYSMERLGALAKQIWEGK